MFEIIKDSKSFAKGTKEVRQKRKDLKPDE
jgi:hypothetical protein